MQNLVWLLILLLTNGLEHITHLRWACFLVCRRDPLYLTELTWELNPPRMSGCLRSYLNHPNGHGRVPTPRRAFWRQLWFLRICIFFLILREIYVYFVFFQIDFNNKYLSAKALRQLKSRKLCQSYPWLPKWCPPNPTQLGTCTSHVIHFPSLPAPHPNTNTHSHTSCCHPIFLGPLWFMRMSLSYFIALCLCTHAPPRCLFLLECSPISATHSAHQASLDASNPKFSLPFVQTLSALSIFFFFKFLLVPASSESCEPVWPPTPLGKLHDKMSYLTCPALTGHNKPNMVSRPHKPCPLTSSSPWNSFSPPYPPHLPGEFPSTTIHSLWPHRFLTQIHNIALCLWICRGN